MIYNMLLVDFPDEILLKIISDNTILDVADLLSLSLCGRRIGYLVIPHLYTFIDFVDNETEPNIERRLGQLNSTLTTYPQRQSWIHAAKFSWTGENVDDALPWLTQEKMFGILTQLPALRSLGIGERIQRSFTPSANIKCGPSKLLLGCCSFQFLRHLIIDDFMITTEDIAEFFTWPSLVKFTVINFIMLYSGEVLLPAQKITSAPQSKIETLEFRRAQHNPVGPLMENLLRNQTQLRSLAIESVGYFRSPFATQMSLCPLQDTLVELELTIVTMKTGPPPHNDGSVLDLSEFKALKQLKVYDHLLFAWPQDYRLPKWTSYHIMDTGLGRRLPPSLESLTVRRSRLARGSA